MAGNEFSVDIQKWIKKVDKNIGAFMLEFTQDLAEDVVTHSPVDTGYFRSSWTAKIGSPDFTKGNETGGDTNSATTQSMTRIVANLIGVKGGDVVYISNNVDYGIYLEYGHSKKAPNGMVREAISRAPSYAEKAARKVNK